MKSETIILALFWIIAFFAFYKYYKIQKKVNKIPEGLAVCTDFIIKNTYQRKYYIFYYKVLAKKEEFIIQDKVILPLFKNKIKINETYKIYFKNQDEYVTPIEVITYKLYLFLSLVLIILPLFFLY